MTRLFFLFALTGALAACGGDKATSTESEAGHGAAATSGEYERGPHRGRMLRDGDFALEVTIFETNVPPQYRLYAYRGDHELALQWLERAYQQKDGYLWNIVGEPLFKNLADDPRYKAFLRKMNLPDD